MSAVRLFLLLAMTAVAISDGATAAVRYPPIYPERQKMSPADRRDAVLDDLGSILTGPTTPTSIATKPYLANEGLCRRDVIVLAYPLTGKAGRGSWAPKPDRIHKIYPQYHYLRDDNTRSWDDWQKACKRLSADKIYWAAGNGNDNDADAALGTLDVAVEAARSGMGVKLDCTAVTENDPSPSFACGPAFIAAAAKVSSFYTCPDDEKDCYAYSTGIYDVTVTIRWRNNNRSAIDNRTIIIKVGPPDSDIIIT